MLSVSSVTIAQVKRDVDTLLQEFCQLQLAKAAQQSTNYQDLWAATSKLLLTGGKRMRPYLTMLAYTAYGGQDYQGTLRVAASQELLHMSMLIHDDVIDKDDIRYGMDNVSGHYMKRYAAHNADVRHYATSAALLAGDVMLSSAYMMILDSTLPPADKVHAAQLIGHSIFDVVGGELDDMESIFASFDGVDALAIAQYKTSTYSFVGPLLSGAWLARASKQDLEGLKEFGVSIGIAFQLADDVLGVFGDEELTGKSAMSDLKEGKRTYLMQYAVAHSDPAQKALLEQHLGNDAMDERVARAVRETVIATGALEATEQCIDEYVGKARAALSRLSLHPEAREPLEDLIIKATQRDK